MHTSTQSPSPRRSGHRTGQLALVFGTAVVAAWAGMALAPELSPDPCALRLSGQDDRLPEASPFVGLGSARAIPAFARKFNMTCTTCHTAFPYLNAFGREFKKAGYRIPDEDGLIDPDLQNRRMISKNLTLDEVFPLALGIEGAPLIIEDTDQDDAEYTFAPFAQLNLLGAGNLAWEGSYYGVLGAEMEGGQAVVTGHGMLGWHPSRYFNLVGGHGNPFHHDPYNSLSPHSIVAVHAHQMQSQYAQAYGWAGPLYYAGGFSAGPMGDLDQERLGHARLALEPQPEFEIGTFGSLGRTRMPFPMLFELVPVAPGVTTAALGEHDDASAASEDAATPREPRRTLVVIGGDLNLDYRDFHVVGVMKYQRLSRGDARAEEMSGYWELFYTWTVDDRPLLMPLLRLDMVHNLDDDTQRFAATGNLSGYVTPNARLGVEYAADLVTPVQLAAGQRLSAFVKSYW